MGLYCSQPFAGGRVSNGFLTYLGAPGHSFIAIGADEVFGLILYNIIFPAQSRFGDLGLHSMKRLGRDSRQMVL